MLNHAKTVGAVFVFESLQVVRKGVHLELADCFSSFKASEFAGPKDD
jgi:hypothetical protein